MVNLIDNVGFDREITSEIYNSESWNTIRALFRYGSKFRGFKSESWAVG